MTERKMILKEVTTLDIDGYLLKDVVKNLTELLAEYGDTAQVSKEPHQYQDGWYMALLKPTPETDAEMAHRLGLEQQARQARPFVNAPSLSDYKPSFGPYNAMYPAKPAI